MWIIGGSSAGYHPNTGVKASHSSHMSRMRSDKSRTMLFSPKVFQVSVGGDSCVGIGIHIGKIGDDEKVCKTNSMVDSLRRRVQV